MKYTRIWFGLVAIVMVGLFVACGNAPGTTTTGSTTVNATVTDMSDSAVSLKVISADMSLSVPTIKNYTCGTNITETYTATFHFPAHNSGGQVKFSYTTTNGRGSTPASLSVHAGQTTATYAFIWSGSLPADNTAPGLGGVMVTSPNAYTSQLVAPSGPCIPVSTAPFKVSSIVLSSSPALTGHACGTSFTETYTATFNIVPAGPGGTIVFQYTTNNGRSGSPNVSLHVAAGQTTATYAFTWSGVLSADHVAPGVGIVMMSAPNQALSPSVSPVGVCS